MPPYIVGRMMNDKGAAAYVLTNVLDVVETQQGYHVVERALYDVINTAFVWRVEVIGANRPDTLYGHPVDESYETEVDLGGGLG